MRIGILGGTFDPPHAGHLALARAAIQNLELDEVLFMPASRNPLKQRPIASAKHRLAMTQILIKDEPAMAVSDLEISRGGQSYAVETLEELQAVQPADYWFIVGGDALKDLTQWKNPDRLLKLCRIAVAVRPPQTESMVRAHIPEEYRERVDLLEMPPLDIASFDIRDRLARRRAVGNSFPTPLLDYVEKNKLYRN